MTNYKQEFPKISPQKVKWLSYVGSSHARTFCQINGISLKTLNSF